ncbi:MAG: hypothetical protein JO182_01935, partial [Acidobacteriaceae bacterium]|nr:hypothetical protein [Acidobacteriaceae bacterium]
MAEESFRYCDLALPVPVDRSFTYHLPLTLQHRVRVGCRAWAPFGTRKLTGVVMRAHNDQPPYDTRGVLKLLDDEPVLDAELLKLAHWIADYYCAPLGEVLKGMLPLSGEVRQTKLYSLTSLGQDVVRQLRTDVQTDTASSILMLLEKRPRSAEFLTKEQKNSQSTLRTLMKRGWVVLEEKQEERDPLRASAERLRAEFIGRPSTDVRLKKGERELLAFLELHPGPHNVAALAK